MAEVTLDTVLQAVVEFRTELTGRIGRLETELTGRIGRLETELTSRVDRLETELTGRVDRIEQGQTRLRVELSERMDRLQTGLDALRQGYVVDWANVERATRIANNAFDDTRSLGEQVMQLTKLVHMLEAQIRDLRGDG